MSGLPQKNHEKNTMKKIFLFAILAIMAISSAQAAGKKSLCVGRFSGASNVGTSNIVALRNSIMTGLSGTGRLDISDVTALGAGDGQTAEIKAANDASCDYLLNGNINTMTVKKGEKYYICEINYTLKVYDIDEEKVFSTETLTATWHSGDTKDEAIAKAIDQAASDMKKYVDNTFKTQATIKSLDEIDKKKGAKTAYVSLGQDEGISAGQMFDIYKEIDVAGSKAKKLIGAAKAKEVVGADLTLVTITKGGVEIQQAFEAGQTIIVETRAKRDIFDGMNKLLK